MNPDVEQKPNLIPDTPSKVFKKDPIQEIFNDLTIALKYNQTKNIEKSLKQIGDQLNQTLGLNYESDIESPSEKNDQYTILFSDKKEGSKIYMKINPKTNQIQLEYPTDPEHTRETRAFEQLFQDKFNNIGQDDKPLYKIEISQDLS